MTETAETTMHRIDERVAEARGFFDLESAGAPALSSAAAFPPPPPTFPPIPTPVPLPSLGVPALPRSIPAMPSGQPNAAFQYAPAAMFSPPPQPPKQAKRRSGGRRFMSWAVVLGLVGGAVYAGVRFGPDLMAQAQGDTTNGEPAAPLVFPAVVQTPTPVRTATIKVERPADDGTTGTYEMTYDFETGVSRMLFDRTTVPDVEVLAVFDAAFLRTAGQPEWYRMPRGTFPFATGPERQRWLRTVDDYLPASIRPHVTIQQATESVLGTEPVRHLVVSIDTEALAAALPTVVTDPTTGLDVPAPPAAPGRFVAPPANAGTAGTAEAAAATGQVTVEMWVDSAGMIRKLALPAELGGETITVVSTSQAAFQPAFPAPEATTPLTAGQLLDVAL